MSNARAAHRTAARPSLRCMLAGRGGELVLVARDGMRLRLDLQPALAQQARRVLKALDGSRSLSDATRGATEETVDLVEALIGELDQRSLMDDRATPPGRSGIQALLDLEEYVEECLEGTVYAGVYWAEILREDRAPPREVLIGTALENFHFLVHEPYFDPPALGFQQSRAARSLFNEFYVGEYGHERLLLSALAGAGLDPEVIESRSIPLASTTALCNALAHWSAADPLYFLTTIGLLEGREAKIDSFLLSCERWSMEAAFVEPLRKHAQINTQGGHGRLSRAMFRAIPYVSDQTFERMRDQSRLLVELYHRFYEGIWAHYSTRSEPWRLLPID